MVDPHLLVPADVLWVLLPPYVASATATIPRGRGPSMDLGRTWPGDGRRVLGASKSWSGFLFGSFIAALVGFLEAWLILLAPPSLQIVPAYGPSVLAAAPVVLLLSVGAMSGDAVGSFLKRRLDLASGTRVVLLDQLPMVAVPILVGALLFPWVFVPTFFTLEALLWLLLFTLVLHTLFNWIGFKAGLKKVPW
ncbi:MAG TPA: CDP-archaeol synthase [Thermoplasmata archaeon]|nr:CDP-archaeol synthase [Thermoplasmata archaeon]